MRLIDADALMERYGEPCHSFADVIYSMPTIESEPAKIDGNTSDGYHTFNELYHHRAVLFSVIVRTLPQKAWKSRKHHDGTMYDGMFIVGIETPDGQATYHYDIEPYWDMFKCKEVEFAPKWDGHTADQAIERIGKLCFRLYGRWSLEPDGWCFCNECKKYIVIKCGTADLNYCPHCGTNMNLEE